MFKLLTSTILLSIYLLGDSVNIFSTNNQLESTNTIKSKNLYLKYTKYPKVIFTNQRFSVELEAVILIPKNKFNTLRISYEYEKNIQILDSNISWEKISNNRYSTKINFKVTKKKFNIPTIKLTVQNSKTIKSSIFVGDNEIGGNNIITQDVVIYNTIDYIKVDAPKIKYSTIAINQMNFSKIIADNLIIKDVKINQYNNKMLMVLLNIEATNSNLEEFYLDKFQEQDIKDFKNHLQQQKMFYYLIVPNHINNILFNYYNPKLSKFINIKIPINLEEDLISTQSNLDPQDNSLLVYKITILGILIIVLLLLYLKTSNKLLILISLILLGIFIKIILPNKTIYLQPNRKIYILPTNLSTIYKDINITTKVEILKEKNGFLKILFQNKNVGWIKNYVK
jgi:hypothetical protein